MTSAAAQTRWAAAIATGLEARGVRHLVLSPGSRSTPLVLAGQNLKRHVIVDERSAGFFALGLARETLEPVALLCTSGSAAGHYLPAVMEAHHSGVPLVVVSADRPTWLVGRGANQTTDQRELFGRFVCRFDDLGDPGSDPISAFETTAALVHAARTTLQPAHLNARFVKPLEPPESPVRIPHFEASLPAPPPPWVDDMALASAIEAISHARRGLVICGPGSARVRSARPALGRFAARSGFPVWAEAGSQLRFACPAARAADGITWALASGAIQPDLIVQIGAAPVTAIAARAPRVLLCERGLPDPDDEAVAVLRGDVGQHLDALTETMEPGRDPSWREQIERASRQSWAVVADCMGHDGLSEPAAIRAAVASTPDTAVLQLGNSQPIRLVDRYCPASECGANVATQRGLSGIDGAVAQAFGAAEHGRPVVALLGDVTFRHDLGSLALASQVNAPVAIIVLDNGGGRLFESLPISRHQPAADLFEECFITPGTFDFGAVAAAYGVQTSRPTTVQELKNEVEQALAHAGCSVVIARVPASSAQVVSARVNRALEAGS